MVNNFTARVQSGVAASCTRGPRCCKRTTLAAISAAASALAELTGVALPRPERIKMHLPRHEQPVHRKGLYLL